jgi:spermidine/putrescine transport system substrate-binding protein
MPALSRRSLLQAALAGSASMLLSACGDLATTPLPPEDTVDRSQLSRTMRLLLWSETISNSVVQRFESAFGLDLLIDVANSNEDIAATLRSGETHGYDLAVVGDYMVATLISAGALNPIDVSKATNSRHIGERHRGLHYDPANSYSLPYFWGTTGVLYDPERVPEGIASWSQLLEPAQSLTGRIGMLDDAREIVAVALRASGAKGSSEARNDLRAARETLLRQRRFVAAYDPPQTNSQRVLMGELDAAMVRTHNAMAARREKPALRYVLPNPICTVWQHNFVIPKHAPSPYTAAALINFMLRPEIAAENSRAVGAASPNQTARVRGLLDKAQTDDPAIYPDLLKDGARFEWLTPLTPEADAEYQAILNAVKS